MQSYLSFSPLVLALGLGAVLVPASLSQKTVAPAASDSEAPVAAAPSLASADWDRDGLVDFLVAHPGGGVALFRNLGDGDWEEATELLGLTQPLVLKRVLWQDYDGSGFADLLFVHAGGGLQLLRNEAGARFVDVTASAGLDLPEPVLDARWQDYDRDGRADLVVTTADGLRLHRGRGETFDSEQFAVTPSTVPPLVVHSAAVGDAAVDEPRSEGPGTEAEGVSRSDSPSSGRALAREASGDRETGGGSNPSAPSGPPMVTGASGICARSVRDSASSDCLSASSVPELGKLYPMSPELFVDAGTGRVDIGTRTSIDVDESGGARLSMRNSADLETVKVAAGPNSGSWIELANGGGTNTVYLDAHSLSGSANLRLKRSNGIQTIGMEAHKFTGTPGSEFNMSTSTGTETVEFLSEEGTGNGAQLAMRMADGTSTIVLDAQLGTVSADLSMYTSAGVKTVELRPEEVAGNGAQLLLRKADGTASITLDAEQNGDGRITTEVLEITGGADLVESFDTAGDCEPGSVLVIDPENPGELKLSARAYDARVAGVVSGAGGIHPGLRMGQEGVASGDTLVALTGRVYVRCTAENGPVRPGDLLTTSSTVGRAMRADDPARSFGSVIGKALTALEDESGLVLVLVNLQ